MIGYHESTTKGGVPKAIDRILELGCNVTQVFLSSPYSTKRPKLNEAEALETKKKLGDVKLFVHGPYTVNFAKDPNTNRWQTTLVQKLLQHAHAYGADHGVVFHMGKCNTSGQKYTVQQGLANMKQSVMEILSGNTMMSRLLLETAAGQGSELCWQWQTFADFYRDLFQEINDPAKLGVCLDTCHLFAAGHDLTVEFLDRVAHDLGGSHHIGLIHLNDSKGSLGCKKDRHELLGQGQIGFERLRTVIRWAQKHKIPMVLETKPPWEPQLEMVTQSFFL